MMKKTRVCSAKRWALAVLIIAQSAAVCAQKPVVVRVVVQDEATDVTVTMGTDAVDAQNVSTDAVENNETVLDGVVYMRKKATVRNIVDQVAATIAASSQAVADAEQSTAERAPRIDIPQIGSPGFPISGCCNNDSATLCLIKNEINGGNAVIGSSCDQSVDLCGCTNSQTIDSLNISIVALLKTLLREIRGLVGEAAYCEACPTVSDLPASDLCQNFG